MAQTERRLAAIMLTDIVGYTAIGQRDELAALELLERHFELVRAVLPAFGGTEVKTLGDGFLIEFPSAVDACRCAIELQRRIRECNLHSPEDHQVNVRIGLHVGDVVFRDQDAFGDGMNVASRIEPLAEPGGICMSEDFARHVRNKLDAQIELVGNATLKNVEKKVPVYRVVLPWETPRKALARRKASHSRLGLAYAVAAFLIAVIGWRLFGQTDPKPESGITAVTPAALAVLPFEVTAPDESADYLGEGISEELINALNKVKGLKVVARTSAFSCKGQSLDAREIGRKLSAASLLEGSVQKEGQRLRVTARLINTSDGYQVWSETFSGSMKDIFSFQDSIARAIAAKLHGQVNSGEEIIKKYTADSRAHTLILQGRSLINSMSRASVEEGIRAFRRALALDPRMAEAYAGIADGYYALSNIHLPPNDVMPQSRSAALKAIALDDSLPSAHASLGQCYLAYDFDFERAKIELDKAIALDPNHAAALSWRGYLAAVTGDYERGARDLEAAERLDPLSQVISANRAGAMFWARQYEGLIVYLNRRIAISPQNPFFIGRKGEALFELGRTAEAFALFDQAKRAAGDQTPPAVDARFHARTGKEARARAILQEDERKTHMRYMTSYFFILGYAALGDKDEAFRWLDRGAANREEDLVPILVDPGLDPLRSDPRFLGILRKLGLAKYAAIAYRAPQ